MAFYHLTCYYNTLMWLHSSSTFGLLLEVLDFLSIWITCKPFYICSLHNHQVGYLVYECNRRCCCSRACQNRVLQNGVQVRLEIFKTEKKVMTKIWVLFSWTISITHIPNRYQLIVLTDKVTWYLHLFVTGFQILYPNQLILFSYLSLP